MEPEAAFKMVEDAIKAIGSLSWDYRISVGETNTLRRAIDVMKRYLAYQGIEVR